jgi:hypothetical protein
MMNVFSVFSFLGARMPRTHSTKTRQRSRGHVVRHASTTLVKLFSYIQPAGSTWKDWTFRTVSLKQAQTYVLTGEAIAVTRMVDGAVEIVGYSALQPVRQSKPSPSCLTFGTMDAVAKAAVIPSMVNGTRPDMGLSYGAERQVEKFKVWALVGDNKAVAVRPRISAEERAHAENLLGGVVYPAVKLAA